jgi:hypothetical protein
VLMFWDRKLMTAVHSVQHKLSSKTGQDMTSMWKKFT